jgi:hypothetical protein
VQTFYIADMRAKQPLPEQLGTLADMAASAKGTLTTNIPFCRAPCECADCETYYRSMEEQKFDRYHYSGILTDAEAIDVLTNYSNKIHSARDYLSRSVQKYGDLLLDRWKKRTTSKRATLLKLTKPDLPLNKGFTADTNYNTESWQEGRSSRHRNHFLLPYIDVETLSKNPATLFGLIHTRAKDSPAEWAPYDHDQLRHPWGVGLVDVSFNEGAVVMCGPRYGAYAKWQPDAAHRFDLVGFPRGRLVLEAQAVLLSFLQRLIEQLLGDFATLDETTAVGCARWNGNLNAGLKMAGDAVAWSAFVQTPFTSPPRFDIGVLVASVKARATATGDHLWLLQTEATYFRRYMRRLSQIQVIESMHQKHNAVAVINWEIVEDIHTHWLWRATLVEFENLQELYHRFRDSIAPGHALPKKVDRALGAIELLLVNTILDRSQQLQAIISQRPGFRNNYVYSPTTLDAKGQQNTSPQFKQFGADEQESNATIFREQRLWWILMQLQSKPDSPTRFRYGLLLDMLDDHLTKASSDERARLDDILYEKISEYATLLELLDFIRMHCPRNTIQQIPNCEANEDRIIWRTKRFSKEVQNPVLAPAIRALRAFRTINAPAGARDSKWLKQYELVHASFHDFWREMETALLGYYQKMGFTEADVSYSMEPLHWWNHPSHIARFEHRRKQIESDIQRAKDNSKSKGFLPLPHAAISSSEVDTIAPARTKDKTRGFPYPKVVDATAKALKSDQTLTKTIALSKSPYTTLRSMFPDTHEEREKSIDWSAFVNSMNEAGFAVRNGGGSIVRFESRCGEGSINFHRPHPDPTIDPVMIQAMGQRMNRWFGWVRETFELVKK